MTIMLPTRRLAIPAPEVARDSPDTQCDDSASGDRPAQVGRAPRRTGRRARDRRVRGPGAARGGRHRRHPEAERRGMAVLRWRDRGHDLLHAVRAPALPSVGPAVARRRRRPHRARPHVLLAPGVPHPPRVLGARRVRDDRHSELPPRRRLDLAETADVQLHLRSPSVVGQRPRAGGSLADLEPHRRGRLVRPPAGDRRSPRPVRPARRAGDARRRPACPAPAAGHRRVRRAVLRLHDLPLPPEVRAAAR